MAAPVFRPALPPAMWPRALRDWWRELPNALRVPLWPSAFATLVIFALLMGFHQVVRQSVRQGELLRMNAATHAEAVWRCKALNGARMRASCLAQIDAPPTPPPRTEGPPPNTVALPSAGVGS